MKTLIEFKIDDMRSIKICVENFEYKTNLYQEATKEIHKFDIVSIFYDCGIERYELFSDILQYALWCLDAALARAINLDLTLDEGLTAGNVGEAYNKLLVEEKVEEVCEFLPTVWSFKNVHTYIYNDQMKAYLEISKRLFDLGDDIDEETRTNFAKTPYKPIALIPLDRSKMIIWHQQCKDLMHKLGIDY